MRLFTITTLLLTSFLGGCPATTGGLYGYTGYTSPVIQSRRTCTPPYTNHPYCRHPDSMPERQNATIY